MLRLRAVRQRNGAITVGPMHIPSARLAGIRRSLPGSLGFLVAALPLLYLLRHFDLLPMWPATLAAGAIGTLAQVLVNNRWAWGNQYPTWSWPAQAHAAGAGAFVSWWVATNALNNLGLEYLLACIGGVAASRAGGVAARTAASPPAAALAEQDAARLGIV